jgi:hypothetical protein
MDQTDIDEISEITRQLEQLQLQQTELLRRLARLTENRRSSTQGSATIPREATPEPTAPGEFVIGDKVRVTNPGPFQQDKGVIVRIGDRITVSTRNNKKVVRDAKNLVLQDDG